MRRSMKRSAVLGASTSSAADHLSARYRIDRRRIRVLPLGVDLELFRPAARPRRNFVFHLGSADPRDQTSIVIEAWSRAHESDASLPRLVIGGSLGRVEPLVRRQAAALGVDLELTGRLTDGELATRFAHAAVVIQPSSDEGFGLQPLEALAAGAPVVVTAAPAVAEVVGDAALVCSENTADIADAVVEALSTGDHLRARARRRARRYDWDASADAVLEALETAASLPRRS
jgi:glycosyltransferase involved in cell wall biosynthesis